MELDTVEDAIDNGSGIVEGASPALLSRDLAGYTALVCDVFPTLVARS